MHPGHFFNEPLAQEILRISLSLCDESYLVGGCIRDTLVGNHQISDLDIAVEGDGFQIAREVADKLTVKASFVALDKDRRTGRIVVSQTPQVTVDISSFKGPTITQDLYHRDFTINSIAVHLWDVMNGRVCEAIIDPLHGREDLERKTIRMSSPNAFIEDPLRMLRAFRFSSQLGFEICPETSIGIRKSATLIQNISGERVRDELEIVFRSNRSAKIIEQMEESSLLWEILPELKPSRGFEQNAFHHLDVWGHTIEALENLETIIDNLPSFFGPLSEKTLDYIYEQPVTGRPRQWLLKLAILFHDSGKPFSLRVDEKGKRRFIGHEKVSKSLFLSAGTRMKLASRELSEVSSWIEGHMRPSMLTLENPSQRVIVRLFHRFGTHFIGLIILFLADLFAAKGPARDLADLPRAKNGARKAIELVLKEEEDPIIPLLDGFDLMSEFGLEQGPHLGSIIRWLVTEQSLGLAQNRDQAREAVRRYLTQKPFDKIKEGT
ncbi:MAG: HD domain-containing protein [Desulfomonilaceae bacterium]